MASQKQKFLLEKLEDEIKTEERKLDRLSKLKFTNGEQVARRIIKNAQVNLARLKHNLYELEAQGG